MSSIRPIGRACTGRRRGCRRCGHIAGVWSHDRKGARLLVEVEPFGRLTRAERAGLQSEAAALARFLGGELELSLS